MQNGDELVELSAGHVVVPRDGGDPALGVKEEGGGVVVDDDCVFEVSVYSAEIFHEYPVVISAVLAK